MGIVGLKEKGVFPMKNEQKDIQELIKKYESSILSDIDLTNTNQIQPSLLANAQKVINNQLIPETINIQMPHSDEETKERMRYVTALEINQKIDRIPVFYIPQGKVEFTSFERLSIPAVIGAALFGLIFYYAFGSFFKEPLYSTLIGMPIGAGFFVWLFSKVIRHPLMSKMVKWVSVAGLAVITIGAVFSGLKKTIVFKPRISFLQWLWLTILTILTFWILHLFKPRKADNSEEIERCLKGQLKIFLLDVYEICTFLLKENTEKPLTETGPFKNEPQKNMFFENSQHIASSVQQMTYAVNNQDKEAALLSVNSFLNSLNSLGIHEKNNEKMFKYTKVDSDYYDSFGIIRDGDMVEQLYSSWVDDQERCVFKGKVKKVKK